MMVKIINKTWYKQYKVRDIWTIHISILGGKYYYSHFTNVDLRFREVK